ncbi:MAG TPA: L-threonine 3-dehydrogenase [Thermoplasmata archaeon]|nr:L-threonine 3-dehydrogenase [Thermoplasmata archaeon]
MTSTMKAAVKRRPVPMATEVAQVPVPEPRPDEVLIRVAIASICGTDLHIYEWDEWAQGRIKTPLIQGHEFAGSVERVGSSVSGYSKGDYVSAEGHIPCGRCGPCRTGSPHVCRNVRILGIDRDGSFAEYLTVPASNVIRNDPGLPVELATMQDPLGNAVYTVSNATVPGKSVAIFGLGPIGLMAVALCRAKAAGRVIAIGRENEYRKALAKVVGADLVLESDGGLVDAVLEATDGEGVDEVLEFAGNDQALRQAIRVVRPAGGIHILGIYPRPVTVDMSEVVTKGVTIHGIHGRLMFRTWEQMRGLLRSGNVNLLPILTHRFPLERYNEAMQVVKGGQCGKVSFPMEA